MVSSIVPDIDVIGSDGENEFENSFEGQSGDRRSHKQEMEKKRRARINDSLGRLKSLVLQALKKDEARYSKLEKADILEMTVKYLQSMRHQDVYGSQASDRYISGFNQCAQHVVSFLEKGGVLPADLRVRLNSHLAGCVQSLHRAALQPQALLHNPLPSPPALHPALRGLDRPTTLTPPHSPEELNLMQTQQLANQIASQKQLTNQIASQKQLNGQMTPQLSTPLVPSLSSHMILKPTALNVEPLYSRCDSRLRHSTSGVGPVRPSVISRPVWRPF